MNKKGREKTALKITNEVKDTIWSPSWISSGVLFVVVVIIIIIIIYI
jgi:hypothetical protein